MKLEQYLNKKKAPKTQGPQRVHCVRCLQPATWCYCALLEPFDSQIKFVILLHPLERRRRIATGRMSHLMLKGSLLIQGYKYTNHEDVDALIADPQYHCVLLCLGDNAKNLDEMTSEEKKNLCPAGKKLLVFVVDGTWGTASKTVRLSENLSKLPRICFSPPSPSMFRVRQQPKDNCYSTIEAIHRTIDLIGDSQGFEIQSRAHDRLLSVFDAFVSKQVQYLKDLKARTGGLQYRRTLRK